jgi:cytochrome c biogenesis protein CcmG, thiol:disulfide interchange protein DsbE
VTVPTDTAPEKTRRPRRLIRWIALVAAVALAAVAIFVATRPSSQATAVQSPLLGQRAPAFSETSFSGHDVTLSDYRGRYVLVNFFASWCPPCQEEEPNLVKFAFQQGSDPNGAAVVSVVFDDPNAAARQFVENWGATWPTIPDPGGLTASAYGVTAPPTTFLISPDGVVVGEETGPVTVAQLDQLLSVSRHHVG